MSLFCIIVAAIVFASLLSPLAYFALVFIIGAYSSWKEDREARRLENISRAAQSPAAQPPSRRPAVPAPAAQPPPQAPAAPSPVASPPASPPKITPRLDGWSAFAWMALGVLLTLVGALAFCSAFPQAVNLNRTSDEKAVTESQLLEAKESLRRTIDEKAVTESQLLETKESLRRTIEEKTALQGQLADLKKALRQTAVELGEKPAVPTRPGEAKAGKDAVVAQPSVPILSRLRAPGDQGQGRTSEPWSGKFGHVTAVDNEAKQASINLGAEDGVAEGMTFMIYNAAENKYLARLTIRVVSGKIATGGLSVIRGAIKLYDNAERIPGFSDGQAGPPAVP